jgi:hypothetical protein
MDWQEVKAHMRNQEEQIKLYRAQLHVERSMRLRLEARLAAVEQRVFGKAGVMQIAPGKRESHDAL